MHDDEEIAKYFLLVDEVVDTIWGLDEKLEERVVVQKVLRYILKKFNPKVSSIEQVINLNSLTLDQLLSTLIAYEMRISNDKPATKVSFFKVDKNSKEEHEDSCCELDEEESKFVRKLKRDWDKYKGKLPFKFFNFGKTGLYATKCPKKEKNEYDPREKLGNYKRKGTRIRGGVSIPKKKSHLKVKSPILWWGKRWWNSKNIHAYGYR